MSSVASTPHAAPYRDQDYSYVIVTLGPEASAQVKSHSNVPESVCMKHCDVGLTALPSAQVVG